MRSRTKNHGVSSVSECTWAEKSDCHNDRTDSRMAVCSFITLTKMQIVLCSVPYCWHQSSNDIQESRSQSFWKALCCSIYKAANIISWTCLPLRTCDAESSPSAEPELTIPASFIASTQPLPSSREPSAFSTAISTCRPPNIMTNLLSPVLLICTVADQTL